jgi:hypothetical protein
MKWTNDKVKHVLIKKLIKTTDDMHEILNNLLERVEALELVQQERENKKTRHSNGRKRSE